MTQAKQARQGTDWPRNSALGGKSGRGVDGASEMERVFPVVQEAASSLGRAGSVCLVPGSLGG